MIDVTTLTPASETLSAAQGGAFNGLVATFTDSVTGQPASAYTANINWGDGNSSPGVVTNASGTYYVTGVNTFAASGTLNVVTTITDPTGARVQAAGTAAVTGIAATIDQLPLNWGHTFTNQELAQFVDNTGYGSSDTAYVNFGSAWVLGTVTLINSTTHTYSVTGSGTLPSGPSVSVGVSVQGSGVTSDVAASNDNAIAPPSTPTLYSTADNATSVTLHWSDTTSDSRTGFQIEEQVDEPWGGNFSLVNTTIESLGSGVYSATIGGLLAGRNYTFRVKAVGVGEAAYSGSLDVTPAPNPDLVPAAPTGLAFSNYNELGWLPVEGALYYDVQYQVGSGPWVDNGPTNYVTFAYVPIPDAGQTYHYDVNTIGSDFIESAPATLTVTNSTSENPPKLASPGLSVTWDAALGCFDVAWDNHEGWTPDGKFYSLGDIFSFSQNGPNGMEVASGDDSLLTPVEGETNEYHLFLDAGGSYGPFVDIDPHQPFQIEAYSTGNYDSSGGSNSGGTEVSITSDATSVTASAPTNPPATPTNLTATISSDGTVNLAFDNISSNAAGFEVLESVNGGTFTQVATLGPYQMSFSANVVVYHPSPFGQSFFGGQQVVGLPVVKVVATGTGGNSNPTKPVTPVNPVAAQSKTFKIIIYVNRNGVSKTFSPAAVQAEINSELQMACVPKNKGNKYDVTIQMVDAKPKSLGLTIPVSRNPSLNAWQGYVEKDPQGSIYGPGFADTPNGTPVTEMQWNKMEAYAAAQALKDTGREDSVPWAKFWAGAIIHEQLWHGLIGKDDTGDPPSVTSGTYSWKGATVGKDFAAAFLAAMGFN